WTCVWARQHPKLFCGQIGTAEKTEILAVALDTGRADKIGELDGTRILLRSSPDDRVLSTARLGVVTGLDWEIGTDRETPHAVNAAYFSDDGRWVFQIYRNYSENKREIRIRPAASDNDEDWKHLVDLTKPSGTDFIQGTFIPIRFTPDGNWIVYHNQDRDGKD